MLTCLRRWVGGGIGRIGQFAREEKDDYAVVSVANELGLFDGVCWDDVLAELYPGLGETSYAVADSLVAAIQCPFLIRPPA